MPAIAVPAFALTWWLACYLVGRDPGRTVLWRAAGALAVVRRRGGRVDRRAGQRGHPDPALRAGPGLGRGGGRPAPGRPARAPADQPRLAGALGGLPDHRGRAAGRGQAGRAGAADRRPGAALALRRQDPAADAARPRSPRPRSSTPSAWSSCWSRSSWARPAWCWPRWAWTCWCWAIWSRWPTRSTRASGCCPICAGPRCPPWSARCFVGGLATLTMLAAPDDRAVTVLQFLLVAAVMTLCRAGRAGAPRAGPAGLPARRSAPAGPGRAVAAGRGAAPAARTPPPDRA